MAEDNEVKGSTVRVEDDGFDYYVRQLGLSSFLLRLLGIALALGTAGAILWAPAAIPRPERSSYSSFSSDDFYTWALLIGINFVLALVFEAFRKRAEAIFEELSDEFQWHLGGEKKRSTEIGPTRPPLGLRVTLRSFLSATDLLLVPGRFGPLFYASVNIVLFVLGAIIRWQK